MSRTIAQIITRDIQDSIPFNLVHFFSSDKSYLVIPLDMQETDIQNMREEFGNWESLEEMRLNISTLSENTISVVEIVLRLGLKNFAIEYYFDFSSSSVIEDLIHFVVKDGKIMKPSILSNINEDGVLYSEVFLDYDFDEQLFYSYAQAVTKYSSTEF